jgi:hypothetical protein
MTVKITKNLVTSSLQRIRQQIQDLPQQAFATWVANTPVRSGNARRKTRLRGDTINANYNYAVPLDQGSSKQSRNGMSQPTEKFIAKQLKKILRK